VALFTHLLTAQRVAFILAAVLIAPLTITKVSGDARAQSSNWCNQHPNSGPCTGHVLIGPNMFGPSRDSSSPSTQKNSSYCDQVSLRRGINIAANDKKFWDMLELSAAVGLQRDQLIESGLLANDPAARAAISGCGDAEVALAIRESDAEKRNPFVPDSNAVINPFTGQNVAAYTNPFQPEPPARGSAPVPAAPLSQTAPNGACLWANEGQHYSAHASANTGFGACGAKVTVSVTNNTPTTLTCKASIKKSDGKWSYPSKVEVIGLQQDQFIATECDPSADLRTITACLFIPVGGNDRGCDWPLPK